MAKHLKKKKLTGWLNCNWLVKYVIFNIPYCQRKETLLYWLDWMHLFSQGTLLTSVSRSTDILPSSAQRLWRQREPCGGLILLLFLFLLFAHINIVMFCTSSTCAQTRNSSTPIRARSLVSLHTKASCCCGSVQRFYLFFAPQPHHPPTHHFPAFVDLACYIRAPAPFRFHLWRSVWIIEIAGRFFFFFIPLSFHKIEVNREIIMALITAAIPCL